jgi:NCS2 family nucleobase:cation symporter-2
MVTLSLIPVGTSKFLNIDYAGEPIQETSLAVAAVTLLTMVGVTIWGSRKLKLYGVLIGSVIGYLLSLAMGLLAPAQFQPVAEASWIGLPYYEGMWQISFRWSLLPTFAIVSICGALKSFGNLTLCEQINDDAWTGPDIRRIGNGLLADAVSVAASGLLGGVASDTSSSNVSLSKASGATSRSIGIVAGVLYFLLGFSPKLSALLSIMPAPVAGAILIFVVCFMLMSGLQIVFSTKPDTQTIFVIGIALSFGVSLDVLPALYAHVFAWLRPLFSSSLTLSTVVAVVLNQLFRLGPNRSAPTTEAAEPAPPQA